MNANDAQPCRDCGAPTNYEGWTHEDWCKHAQTYAPGTPPPDAVVRGPRPLHGPGYCPECSREEKRPIYHT